MMKPKGLGLSRGAPRGMAYEDEPTPYIPGVQYGPTEWEKQNPDKLRPDDDETMPDDELERRQSEWDAENGEFDRFRRAVEADRPKDGSMSTEHYDRWDMNWRKRAKKAGLDEQEVDAFMDSLWEGYTDPEDEFAR